jgi:hypothetical protein
MYFCEMHLKNPEEREEKPGVIGPGNFAPKKKFKLVVFNYYF